MDLPRVPVKRILAELERLYPEVGTALHYGSPFQLLVATMLSAQCTDVLVNKVTPALFAAHPTAADYVDLSEEEMGRFIQRCGLWRTKAKHIVAAARILHTEHGGQVPGDFDALTRLPGVGRKTANVVLANAFGVPAIAVDTHVFRVANRLGLARAKTPEETERQLRRRIPKHLWARAHHWLIWHGRLVCVARNPRCAACTLLPDCPFGRQREPELARLRRKERKGEADAVATGSPRGGRGAGDPAGGGGRRRPGRSDGDGHGPG